MSKQTMHELVLEAGAGPCDPRDEIEDWIDELLDLRVALAGSQAAIAEIDFHLRRAASWLADREAGRRCA